MEILLGVIAICLLLFVLIGLDLPLDFDLEEARNFEKNQENLSRVIGGEK